ncbi:hypothetical protein GCM10007073_22780 [Micrococcus flavus]|nr:hypothetical protein GCM10007073_22780 [Micrococcus flavus]
MVDAVAVGVAEVDAVAAGTPAPISTAALRVRAVAVLRNCMVLLSRTSRRPTLGDAPRGAPGALLDELQAVT